MDLTDKRILITGAGGGIGRALVSLLLDEGAQVLLTGRDHAALLKVIEHHAERDRAAVFAADLSCGMDRARLCDFALRWRGGVDLLINNAAVNDFNLLTTQSADELDAAVATNLIAPIDLCRRLIPRLELSDDARIVNIGSVLGSIGFAANSVYCATKFGLRGFSESLRRELADTNIRVHYFAPRTTRTAFNNALIDDLNKALGNPADDPAEVARHIVRALRDDEFECILGRRERLLARLNALLPRLVDVALLQKLATIRDFASRSPVRPLPRPAVRSIRMTTTS
ncbi:SDR family oxidoreductase [Steroidobacter flavus]|uniref:SDR family oxidoreductase n=1 Tax=Steroidobacter flavus TaxID=1842136 RepID=A0ABV8T6P3_9GAMM